MLSLHGSIDGWWLVVSVQLVVRVASKWSKQWSKLSSKLSSRLSSKLSSSTEAVVCCGAVAVHHQPPAALRFEVALQETSPSTRRLGRCIRRGRPAEIRGRATGG